MIYITYDNSIFKDGFGAQLQRILSLYIICSAYNIPYYHSPLILDCPDHQYEENMIQKLNDLFFPVPEPKEFSEVVSLLYFNLGPFQSLCDKYKDHTGDICIKACFAHEFLDRNAHLIREHQIRLPWVSETINPVIQICMHIRRGDVNPSRYPDRFVPTSFYINCLENLDTIFADIPHQIHIHSEGEAIQNELSHLVDKMGLILHIDESPYDSFVALTNADILFAGHSSFSYSATILRLKGMVLYTPIMHSYTETDLVVRNPEDILNQSKKILSSVGI